MLPHTEAPEICKRERRSSIRGDWWTSSNVEVETILFAGSGCIDGSKVQLFTDCNSEMTTMATRKHGFIGCHCSSRMQEEAVKGEGGVAMVMNELMVFFPFG